MNRKRLRPLAALLPLILLAVAVGGFFLLPRDSYRALQGLKGPLEEGLPAPAASPLTAWKEFGKGGPSRMAVYLTDPNSAWTGVQHALETMGIPYIITDDPAVAVQHRVVLVYPMISGKLLDREKQETLRKHVADGGCLLATQVLGTDLKDLFGYTDVQESRSHYEVKLSPDHADTNWLKDERERTVRLGNPERPQSWTGTQNYSGAAQVLATFQDGQAAWIAKEHPGGGLAMALGFDLGFFILKCQNDRDDEASRAYVNEYEPTVDVWLRLLRHFYQKHEPLAVTVHTVPEGKSISAVISLDIDYVKSMANMTAYRDLLVKNEVPATFFIQAKYYRDYFDTGFFNDDTVGLLRSLHESGMEIASHSVAHTDVFASLPLGDGREKYPDYQPRVKGKGDTRNATVMGELRVSKYLLESITGAHVRSFRPGYLACPPSLAQAMEASGYHYTSSVTSGNVMTYLPYRKNYNHEYTASTNVFEFPAAVEDEHLPLMDQRVEGAMKLAGQLAQYGGCFVVLSHPDVIGHKHRFLQLILPRLKPMAWIGTIGQLGDWWSAREQLEIDVTRREAGQVQLSITAPTAIKGITLYVPPAWKPSASSPLPSGATLEGGSLFLPEVPQGALSITLQEKEN
ncbi:polysaccharide deacetylase family protein [Roseimicrobium sp. ORNL1]|uniref:polysaccharide deacetylase family protein n=1 Tax=Roseimicrobium sp. ORNL1 TaxID=2711231 RepID=UPI0013E1519D|nr:polysaccharide deacetylase family protein [Roseimicrobium sp. ORNL1]QIF01730.1 polysaccharide deacetylase family protein [Roseimicrobium sp. ORNL1]